VYEIDPAKRHLIEEFRARPRGPYGLELAQLSNRLRMGPAEGRHVLVCTKRQKEWVLARLPGGRGERIEPTDRTFNDLNEAEWEVFKLRWREHTGEVLD